MKNKGQAKFNRIILGLLASVTFLSSVSAYAETDMTKIKCAEFNEILQGKDHDSEVAGSLFLGFLWGLYKGWGEPAIIGTPSDNQKAAKLGKYCEANPKTGLITAVQQVWNEN